MQIILVETEVRQALRNYVASRLTLSEGTEIQIDLSATRGADGIKATIDLIEPGASAPMAAAPAPTKAATKPAAAPVSAPTPAPAPQAQEQQQDAAKEASSDPQEASTGPADATDGAASNASAEAAQEAAAAAPVPKTSLFAGLNRPKNP